MKRFNIRLAVELCLLGLLAMLSNLSAQESVERKKGWQGDAFSLFIHYGLYSIPGGVWNGQPVRQGYSEQILSFGVHFMDWYEELTKEMHAENFSAKQIVQLAKHAGMKSVIMTAKHHDGFCLFRSDYTPYNVWEACPAKRDLIGELAAACHEAGLRFGLYYSLIDWHYPGAMPISSHNADSIPLSHHQYNMAQVMELLTRYGQIDELWFDMGSLLPSQSWDLYQLVKDLQPNCMVSGRLGNDYADFSVMPDNAYPDYRMVKAWQTPASMFDETWGYRSWQERGSVEDKVREKFRSLIEVISRGGKYLLNIGPKGDGSIVPFEADVLKEVGKRTHAYSDAIYDTHANPLPEKTKLLATCKGKRRLFIFVPTAKTSTDTVLTLPAHQGKLSEVHLLSDSNKKESISFQQTRSGLTHLKVPAPSSSLHYPFRVIELEYASDFNFRQPEDFLPGTSVLSAYNAEPLYSHSTLDYYCSYKSIVGYEWSIAANRRQRQAKYAILYPSWEEGTELRIKESGEERQVKLHGSAFKELKMAKFELKRAEKGKIYGVFGREPNFDSNLDCFDFDAKRDTIFPLSPRSGMLLHFTLDVKESGYCPIALSYADGILVYQDQEYLFGDIYRRSLGQKPPKHLLLYFSKGIHTLSFKVYNRFGDFALLKWQILPSCLVYKTETITLSLNDRDNEQSLDDPVILRSFGTDPFLVRPAGLESIRFIPQK